MEFFCYYHYLYHYDESFEKSSHRAWRRSKKDWKSFLVLLHPLSNIKITKYFSYEPRFNGFYLRDNLPRTKDEVHVINLDDKQSKRIHWVSLFIHKNTAVYFDSLGIEYIPQ